MDNQHDINVLNTLIVTTIDSALSFEESARDISNSRHEEQFRQFAGERRQVIRQLQAQARRLGGTPKDDGSVKAAAHRRWVDLKSTVAGKSDKAVIAEVNNGETYIREKYELALKDQKLSPETRFVIERGLGSVRAGQFFASRLEQALSSASSGSSTRTGWGLKVAGAAGLVGVAYAAYRMLGASRSPQERRSLQPRLAQEYDGGRDVEGRVQTGQSSDQSSSSSAVKGLDASASAATTAAETATDTPGYAASSSADQMRSNTIEEERIAIVEEQLRVGKQEVSRGGATVKSHIVEQPVHEQVTLKEEHVSIERQPVDRILSGGDLNADSDLLRDRTIEMTATAEEAVIEKEARVREELVVRKTAEERTETIEETVRRTEVDADEGLRDGSDRSALFESRNDE